MLDISLILKLIVTNQQINLILECCKLRHSILSSSITSLYFLYPWNCYILNQNKISIACFIISVTQITRPTQRVCWGVIFYEPKNTMKLYFVCTYVGESGSQENPLPLCSKKKSNFRLCLFDFRFRNIFLRKSLPLGSTSIFRAASE